MFLLNNNIKISCDTNDDLRKGVWYSVLAIESFREAIEGENGEPETVVSVYCLVSGRNKKAVLIDLESCKIKVSNETTT